MQGFWGDSVVVSLGILYSSFSRGSVGLLQGFCGGFRGVL
jgi:hypothetical protein